MKKCRYYCRHCRKRYEDEIVLYKPTGQLVYYGLMVSEHYQQLRSIDLPPICTNCGQVIEKCSYVSDVPDRYIDDNGVLKDREYKELK